MKTMAIDPMLFKKLPRKTDLFQRLDIMDRREKIYAQMSADEMSEALSKIGVHLTKQDILDIFNTNYSTEDTINKIFNDYPETAEALDQRNLYINSDIILEIVDHSVIEEYGITHIPDPGVIGDYLDDLCSEERDYTFKDIIDITKSINGIKEHYEERNLDELFGKAIGLYSMDELYDILKFLNGLEHTPQDSLDLLDQVKMIAKDYSFENKAELLTSAFNIAIKDNPDQADELKKIMNKTVKR